MLNASESADDASADDTGSDDDSAGDGEASDASEGSAGRLGKARILYGRSSHGILIQFDPRWKACKHGHHQCGHAEGRCDAPDDGGSLCVLSERRAGRQRGHSAPKSWLNNTRICQVLTSIRIH